MKIKLRNLAKEAISTFLLAAVIMTGYNLYLQRDTAKGTAPELQGLAIRDETVSGEHLNLQELSEGQPVLVYFWGSWCSICNWVSPSVSSVAEDYPVITVALASGSHERVSRYLQAKELNFPAIDDNKGSISRTWGVNVTPSIFIVKDGKIQATTTGYTTTLGMLLRLWWHS